LDDKARLSRTVSKRAHGWPNLRAPAMAALILRDRAMTGDDEDYVYDEDSGEWMPDANGNLLADGDQVVLIKDLTVKGAGQTLKQGTVIKSIRLTADAQEIDCRFDGIKGLVLRAEFVKKR
jgi:protein PhnA